jgi:hypothetical protein
MKKDRGRQYYIVGLPFVLLKVLLELESEWNTLEPA